VLVSDRPTPSNQKKKNMHILHIYVEFDALATPCSAVTEFVLYDQEKLNLFTKKESNQRFAYLDHMFHLKQEMDAQIKLFLLTSQFERRELIWYTYVTSEFPCGLKFYTAQKAEMANSNINRICSFLLLACICYLHPHEIRR
jgi:hypothetical protein